MSPLADAFCPHERRPGTAVCLHCRRDARLAARAKRRRAAAWIGTVLLSLAVVAVVGVSGLAAFTPWRPPPWLQQATIEWSTTRGAGSDGSRFGSSAASPGRHAGLSVSSPLPAPAAPRLTTPPLTPIVAEGSTMLPDSMIAVRTGESVRVHFDTRGGRTRRPEKFEQIVRATLPAIYGPAVDSLLATIPPGTMATAGNLMTDLPKRGLRLSLGTAGWMLALWPETRTGHGGPLVTTYRALVTR